MDESSSSVSSQRCSVLLSILIGVFAIGSWIDVNGLWVELPLIVDELPEYWELPTYISVVIQAANIGPLSYIICVWLCKGKKNMERITIYIILIIGALSCLFLAMFWKNEVVIDKPRSIPFLTLVFCLALVDCTSSITFLPYMASFPTYYMSAFYIGEGCSGLIPAIMALIQGVGVQTCEVKNVTENNITIPQNVPVPLQPHFSVEVFMYFLMGMLILSLTSFIILDCVPRYRLLTPNKTCAIVMQNSRKSENHCVSNSQREAETTVDYIDPATGIRSSYNEDSRDAKYAVCPEIENSYSQHLLDNQLTNNRMPYNTFPNTTEESKSVSVHVDNTPPKLRTLALFMILIFVSNLFTNGFLPALQTYSALPYNVQTYHLTVVLVNIINPLTCFVTLKYHTRQASINLILSLVGLLFAVYIIILACMSPNPPLKGTPEGSVLQIIAWLTCYALLIFVKASVAIEMRCLGKRYLVLCGAFTQIGSIVGALIPLMTVNIFHLFKEAPRCKPLDNIL